MFDAKRIAGIKSLQRDGEAAALYAMALMAPPGTPFVELGTFHGYTTAVLAMACERTGGAVTTIDDYVERAPDKLPPHVGPEAVRANLAACRLGATVLVGDTRTVPPGVTGVGFLYVDSTHTAAQFTAEMAAWLPHVVVGGIVAGHDYGGANTPELKPVIDRIFGDRRRWRQVGAYHTQIGFQRVL